MTLPRLEYEHIQNKDFIIFPEQKAIKRNSFKLKLERKKKNKITRKRKKKSVSKSNFGIF